MTRAALPLLFVVSLSLGGCVQNGLAWVQQPPSGGFGKRDAQAAAEAQRASEPSEENGKPLGIRKTISLGESVTASDVPPEQVAQAPLVVQTNPYYHPLSYGVVPAIQALEPALPVEITEPILIDPDPVVVQQQRPAGVQPGQNFPPPPSFGPPFPFRSAPADPFAP